MYHFLLPAVSVLTLLVSTIEAAALPQGVAPAAIYSCVLDEKYTNLKSEPARAPSITGNLTSPGTGGTTTFSLGVTYTVGVTITIGADLGLDISKILGAGIGVSVSVATATTEGQTQGVTKGCPDGPWHCSLIITPAAVHVTGTYEGLNHPDASSFCVQADPKPYDVLLPVQTNGIATGAEVDICACPNYDHWADPGAPSIVCPQPCEVPPA